MPHQEEFKAKLEMEFTAVTAELETIATQDPTTSDWVAVPEVDTVSTADANVEADVVEDWNSRRAIVAQLEVRYRNIARALEKLAAGTYGVCEISGEPIELERLVVNPAARTNLINIDRERELPL